MNSRDYWLQREAEQLKHNITEEAEYDRQLKQIYQNMLDACQKEIDSFYGKYAAAEGISIAEAKKRVSKLDIAAYERKAKKYVKEKEFSQKANEELRLYNATMKINRLEMLKANIGLETIAGHDELEKFMAGVLKGRTEAELKRQAGILGKTVKNNAQKANAIVNGSFHSGTFSDRIWQYQDIMRQDLGRLLQQGLIQGKGARAIAKDLKKYWYGNDPKTGGGATYCMERLMRTELARVQTEAQKQSFERNGFDMYQFICNVNPTKQGTCSICRRLASEDNGHGKGVYLVKDMMPGTNAPPMHPHCRCSTAAYEDDAEYEAWLDFLDNGGTTAEWNEIKLAKQSVKTISSPIKSRNTAAGRPQAIMQYDVELNNRQKRLLEKLDKYNATTTVKKKDVSMTDLAALTAKTGVEFAMFTRKDERMVMRGNAHSVNVDVDKAKELSYYGYRWSGHTHPGTNYNCMLASDEDYVILEAFGQKRSVTYNSLGHHLTFELEGENDDS